ncbi:MAG: hypothetical protein HZB33_04665 [Nitrospirae bacterium]|nr:hypothetical protein [Nitrospirota bacterium]
MADESLPEVWAGIDNQKKRETNEGDGSMNKVACPLFCALFFVPLESTIRRRGRPMKETAA